jgi:hypothetical protein
VAYKALKYGVSSYVTIGAAIWVDTSLQSSFPSEGLHLFTKNSNVFCYKDNIQDELQGATDCFKPLNTHHINYYKPYCDMTPTLSY